MSDTSPPPPTTPEPTEPAGPRTSSSSLTGDQLKSAVQASHPYDLAIMAAGLLAFIFSLFAGYYTVSFLGQSGGFSAWHGFFGWFAALLALAGAVVLALPLLGVRLTIPMRTVVLALFAAASVCVLLALFVIPGKVDCGGLCSSIDYGHGFAYWISLILILAGTGLAFMRKDAES